MSTEDLKRRMSELTLAMQDSICQALEREDGAAGFQEDSWTREGGGGGRSRVLEDGQVFEKAGVNSSAVFGELSEAFSKRLQGEGRQFFASGLSLVLHPKNPFVPTVHANVRLIVQGSKVWFGGGADLTPWYLFEEDAKHFHTTLKSACDRYDPTAYARFKKACDDYFWIKHRVEARGVGGIFFEEMHGELERQFELAKGVLDALIPAYLPIVQKRRSTPFGPQERAWQEIRRGRYVEFNLVYDRGTLFGLETQGRTESILMSLPPKVAWVYDHHPAEGSDEARLVQVLRHPRDWA